MSLFYGLIGFLIGLVIYHAIPFLLPKNTSTSTRAKLSKQYYNLMTTTYDRMILNVNNHGDYRVDPSSYHQTRQADEITINGDTEDYQDKTNAMTLLYGNPIGVANGEFAELFRPSDVAIAHGLYDLEDENKHITQFQVPSTSGELSADGGSRSPESIVAMCPHVTIEGGYDLVDVRDVKHRMVESFEPNDPEKAEIDVKNSQEGFKSRNTIELMIHLITAVAGAGFAWLIWSNTSGESAITVPIQLVGVIG